VGEEGKGAAAKYKQDLSCAWDATGLCVFVSMGIENDDVLELLSAATGEHIDETGFLKIGERVFNLQRLFNLKAGIKKVDETLPERFFKEPLPDGMNAGAILSLEEQIKEYYSLRGWNGDYVPTREKLEELGLSEYI
jgi:aldehyde:ferredoxin oxidoreductase